MFLGIFLGGSVKFRFSKMATKIRQNFTSYLYCKISGLQKTCLGWQCSLKSMIITKEEKKSKRKVLSNLA